MTSLNMKKTILAYVGSGLALFIFQYVYHLFGHGVTSISLKFVWLVPIIGGLVIILLNVLLHTLSNRLAFNLYNCGLACLANGMILKGILEIAGSDSPYLSYFYIISYSLLIVSMILFISQRILSSKSKNQTIHS